MKHQRGETKQPARSARPCTHAGSTPGARLVAKLHSECGQAVVEMAVVLPLLLAILTGTASFSMALFSMQQLGNAASTSAQQLGADQGLVTDPCATAVTAVTTALPNWTASKISYKISITDSGGTAHNYPSSGMTAGSSFSCTAGAGYMDANEPVTVTLSYQYTWFPILNFSPSSALTASEAAMME